MFKRFLITLCLLLPLCATANYNDIYVADLQYDWIDKSEVEKEAMISEVHDAIFQDAITKRKDLKILFKDKLKDKNHLENYMAASAGYSEYKGNNISAFFYKKMVNPYMYALQDKQDLSTNLSFLSTFKKSIFLFLHNL